MKFEEKTIKNKKVYMIDGKVVSSKAYETLKSEYDVSGDNCEIEKCPRCTMIYEMAEDIWNSDDEDDAFETLKDIINMIEDSAYREGYKDCLINQNEINNQMITDLDLEDDE